MTRALEGCGVPHRMQVYGQGAPRQRQPAPGTDAAGWLYGRRGFLGSRHGRGGERGMTMPADQNEWFRCLNAGLPDDVARLKAGGVITRRPSGGSTPGWPRIGPPPQNGARRQPRPRRGGGPAGGPCWSSGRYCAACPAEYIYTEQQAVEKMQARGDRLHPGRAAGPGAGRPGGLAVRGRGKKRCLDRFDETLLDTDPRLCRPPAGALRRTAARPWPAAGPPMQRWCGRARPRPASRWRPA